MSASIWNPGSSSTAISSRFLHAIDFLAFGAGADETSQLRAAFDAAITAKRVLVLRGNYLVSNQISSNSYANGELHIFCDGDVTITVDPAATPFITLLSCNTTAINNAFLGGGRLTIDLNNRCSNGVYIRHAGGNGGTVNLGPLTVKNAKETRAVDSLGNPITAENQSILVYGRYFNVELRAPIVDGVDRTSTVAGACKGISISDIVGTCTIYDPQVSRVLCTGSTADADGIAVFGYDPSGTVYGDRLGKLTILNATITDCQGRAIKTQLKESEITNLTVIRQGVVAFSTADVDHQVGGVHKLINPTFRYRKNAGVSPIPSNWRPISLQHQCTDRPGMMRVEGGALQTEVAMEQICSITASAAALAGTVELDGFEVQAMAGLGAPITRAVMELPAGNVQASGGLHISIQGCRGNFSAVPLLGYTGASANMSKLSFDIRDNENTGADGASGAAGKVFGNLSGTVITQVGSFRLSNNAGFYDLLGTWNFDYETLKPGSFTYTRGTSTVSNGPVLTGTYPRVIVHGSNGSALRDVQVIEDTGSALKIHFYQDGANWRNVT